MASTVDEQLSRLAELHQQGSLTDHEFASAKAAALDARTTNDVPAGPRTVYSVPEAFALLPIGWIIFVSLILGLMTQAIGSAAEWEPIQRPAAPFVCSGGTMQTGFEVSYSVAAKGVDNAVTCDRDGVVSDVSGWWMFLVLTVIYSPPFLLLFLVLKLVCRRKLARGSPTAGVPPTMGVSVGNSPLVG